MLQTRWRAVALKGKNVVINDELKMIPVFDWYRLIKHIIEYALYINFIANKPRLRVHE